MSKKISDLTPAVLPLDPEALVEVSVPSGGGYMTRMVAAADLANLDSESDAADIPSTPGGADKQVQFNDAGVLAGEAGFEYNKTTNRLRFPIGWVGVGINPGSSGGADLSWLEIVNDPAQDAGSVGAGRPLFSMTGYSSAGYANTMNFNRAYGSEVAPTTLTVNARIFALRANGYDGTAWASNVGSIACQTSENWAVGAHGTIFRFQVVPPGTTTAQTIMDVTSTGLTITGAVRPSVRTGQAFVLTVAASDENTALTAGTAKVTFRVPAVTLSEVRASLTTAQASGSTFTVDINEAGTSILSTKLTLDNTEKTSVTAATPAVISDVNLADDAEITIDIDTVGDGTATGLKVTLLGVYA